MNIQDAQSTQNSMFLGRQTEIAWLATDTLSIPQTDIVKKPDDWEIVKKRTIPRFGRAIDVPAWRPPLEEALGTKKVSIFVTETPLSQVLSFLGDLTEIDFVADLGEEAVDPLMFLSMRVVNGFNWRSWQILVMLSP